MESEMNFVVFAYGLVAAVLTFFVAGQGAALVVLAFGIFWAIHANESDKNE